MTKPIITYVAAGLVERARARKGRKMTYVWSPAYSRDGVTFPWVTRREAQAEARAEGARAVFKEPS